MKRYLAFVFVLALGFGYLLVSLAFAGDVYRVRVNVKGVSGHHYRFHRVHHVPPRYAHHHYWHRHQFKPHHHYHHYWHGHRFRPHHRRCPCYGGYYCKCYCRPAYRYNCSYRIYPRYRASWNGWYLNFGFRDAW